MTKKFIHNFAKNVFRFGLGVSKNGQERTTPAAESFKEFATSSGFFVPFATGKSATLCVDSPGLSTASLIGFGNCSCEHTQIMKTKSNMKISSLKNHFYFPIPAKCRLIKIVANFSAYEANINDSVETFPCVYIAKSKGAKKPFKLIESTKTSSETSLKRCASCLKMQEMLAVSEILNIDLDFSDRIAICLALEAKGNFTGRSEISLFCNGSLLFGQV